MKQFKELSIDEQLNLVKHVLEGNDLACHMFGEGTGTVYGDTDDIHICKNHRYEKLPTKLETLYKAQQDIQEKIDAELKHLGEPVSNDNTSTVQSPSEQEKTSEDAPLERITRENWKSFGIKVGDKVKVVNASCDIRDGVYDIQLIDDCDDGLPFELENVFMGPDYCEELYLIRTKEGSLDWKWYFFRGIF